jgi:hypothetical protein
MKKNVIGDEQILQEVFFVDGKGDTDTFLFLIHPQKFRHNTVRNKNTFFRQPQFSVFHF